MEKYQRSINMRFCNIFWKYFAKFELFLWMFQSKNVFHLHFLIVLYVRWAVVHLLESFWMGKWQKIWLTFWWISKISICILISYDSSKSQQININPYEKNDIGIELYSLNILQNVIELNLSYVKKKMKNKEYTHYAIVFTEKITLDSFDIVLKQIFNEFWERQVLNVIVVFWTNKLNGFTYSPFGKHFFYHLTWMKLTQNAYFMIKQSISTDINWKLVCFLKDSVRKFLTSIKNLLWKASSQRSTCY